jgi:hypothetical protein
MKFAISFCLIAVGFILLIISGFWVAWFPGTSTWTMEKNERYADVKDRMHNLGFMLNDVNVRSNMHSGNDRGTVKQEFDTLKKEYDELSSEFMSAHDSPRTVATVLKWSGIGLAALGLVGYYAAKQSGA